MDRHSFLESTFFFNFFSNSCNDTPVIYNLRLKLNELTDATFLLDGAIKEVGANAEVTPDDRAITRAERLCVNFIVYNIGCCMYL